MLLSTHQNIWSTSRNTQRIIHFPPQKPSFPTLQVENEMKIRVACTMASASMGHIILGKELGTSSCSGAHPWWRPGNFCTLSWKSLIYPRYNFPTSLQHACCMAGATVTLFYNTLDALIEKIWKCDFFLRCTLFQLYRCSMAVAMLNLSMLL